MSSSQPVSKSVEDCLREVGSGAVVIGDASATVTRHDDICISSADEDVSSTDDGLCKDGGSGSVKKTEKMNPWFRAIFIMFLELFERLTFYSFVFNITHYLRNFMGFSSDQSISVKLAWNFVGYGSTIFGGLLADCVLGRKRTLLYVAIAYACMTCLAAVSTLPSLTVHVGLPGEPTSALASGQALWMIGAFGVALCMGGIKANVSPMGADQFDPTDPEEKKAMESFFSWFYQLIQIGGLVASVFPGFMQGPDPETWGYTLGWFLAAGFMVVGLVIYLIGWPRYIEKPVEGADLTSSFSAIFAAMYYKTTCGYFGRGLCGPSEKKNKKKNDNGDHDDDNNNNNNANNNNNYNGDGRSEYSKENEKSENVTASNRIGTGCDDDDEATAAAAAAAALAPRHNWIECVSTANGGRFSPEIVADAHQYTRTLPVWISYMIFCVVYGQVTAQFVLQGEQMDDRGYFNSSMLSGIADGVSCMINIALVQYVVRPICENWFGWKLTPLRKFYCALVCAMFAMGISMGVEVARKNSPLLYNPDGTVMLNSSGAPQHAISVFLLIPQYYMVAFGEAFAWVAGIEFYYREIPESMKGIGQATNQMANACSSIFELILVQIVTPFNWLPDNLDSNNGLTYYYCMLLVFCFLAFFWGIFCDWLYARGGGSYEDMVIARKIAEKRRSEGVAAATAFEAGKGADIKED